MNLEFYQLAIGAEFEWQDVRFRKTGLNVAIPMSGGNGCVIMGDTMVISNGPLLPPEDAAKGKPDLNDWGKALGSWQANDE